MNTVLQTISTPPSHLKGALCLKIGGFLQAQKNMPNVNLKLLHPVQDNNKILISFDILQLLKKHYSSEFVS